MRSAVPFAQITGNNQVTENDFKPR
jgi:hypothetical protein